MLWGSVKLIAQDPYFRQVPLPATNTGFRINAICQDTLKFIWLATNEGIFKNDGLNFVRQKLPVKINDKNITSIAALNGGGIVAGTSNGILFTIVKDEVVLKSTVPYNVNVPISSITATVENEIWFTTTGEGLYRILNDSVMNYRVKDGIADDYIYCITTDYRGRLWIGSDAGLTVVTRERQRFKFRNINTKNGLPDNIIRQVTRGPGNTIGICMEEKGFCLYNFQSERFEFTEQFSDWSQGPITAIAKLDNEFWLGTQKFGIVDFEFQAERRTRQFSDSAGFIGTNVNAMLKDHEGNIWIGAGGELFLSPGEEIEFKPMINGRKLNTIHTLLIDRNDKIWFSNDSGLYCFKKNLKDGFRLDIPVKAGIHEKLNVISMYEDSYGFLWMGTFDFGVYRYDPVKGKWRNFSEKEGLVNASVLSIDGYGKEIWFATLGGVSKCDLQDSLMDSPVVFTSYNEQHGLGNNFVYKVFVDSKNRVWFGTDGKGITSYENGKFNNYSGLDGLKSKVIYSIAEDDKGFLWISSSGNGIYRFDGKSFRNISVDQGLNDLNVTSLVTDSKGNIIVVHKKGIDVLNPDNFYLQWYGSEMGIGVIDPDLNVTDADKSGNVWIGTTNGIIKLNLEQRIGEQKPVLRINNVLCFLEKVDTSASKVFDYDRNHISFEYSTLWFADPQRVSYQYKLEGYNREWITTRDRFITFPNLRSGNYIFMLRTSVNNNFSNSNVVSYSFEIEYPFWEQPWFILLCTVIVLVFMYFYIRYRDRRLKSIERLKKEKIESQYEILKNQVNPHFLFNSFNTLITVIEDDREIAIEYVNKLSDFFRCILTYREKDLIYIKEELELVESYVFLQQKRYGSNFKVHIRLSEKVREHCLIPPLAIQILIENCLKHNSVSRETKLVVEITEENNEYLVVKNNINPKYTKDPSTGIGLQNLKNRYLLIKNAEIIIEKTDDSFIVKLPLIGDK